MNKFLVIVSLLLISILCLKQTQVGRNDWHMQNIGQLSFVHLFQNKLFYLTHLNVLGHLKLDSGQIETRITLSNHERLLSANQQEITFVTENNQIIGYKVHSLQRQVNNRFVNDKILKSIKSYVRVSDGKTIILNDQKNIRTYTLENSDVDASVHVDIYTAQPNEIIQRIFYFGDKLYACILRDGSMSFRQISKGQLNTQQILPQFSQKQNFQDWSLVQAWQSQGNLVVLMHNKELNSYNTYVLNETFESIYQIANKYNQVVGNQLVFCSKVYNLKQRKQTQRLNLHTDSLMNIEYSIKNQQEKIDIFKGDVKYASINKPSSNLNSRNVFLFQRSSFGVYLVVQYCDMTIEAYSVQNGNVQRTWARQEGLAYIDKILFMKYPFSDHLDNDYHRNLLSQNYLQMALAQKLARVPANIALRIKEELADLIDLVSKSVQSFLDFSKLSSIDLKDLSKFRMSEEQELKLGLKKYIVAVTKKGAIYSIDTKTNKILWKKNRHLSDQKTLALIDLRKDYELEAAVLITYNTASKQLIFEQIKLDGTIILLDKVECPVQPSSIHKLNHESIIINVGDKTLRYQLGQSHAHSKNFYFYTVEERRVVGWKQLDKQVVEIWNFNLEQGQKVIATASAFHGQQRSHVPLFDNGKVIFKNVDFTNLAILTSKNATSMSLYIINGMTGQVHFNEFRSGLNLNHPVNLAYDQNNVIVTYYNNRNKLYEIWAVEQYQERIQTSAINMIKDYLEGLQYKPSRNRQNIIFLSQVYGAPVSVKKMFISGSKESLIRRNLVIITRDDKLYIIGRELVSTRRPKQTALFSNEAYPPYQYLLPLDQTKFFSYNLKLHGLDNIHFSPSDMESTIFIMAYGIDIFMIRVAPDMPFDMITEDFNYLVLVLIMVAVSLGVLILRHKAIKARLIKPHRD